MNMSSKRPTTQFEQLLAEIHGLSVKDSLTDISCPCYQNIFWSATSHRSLSLSEEAMTTYEQENEMSI